MVKKIKHVVLNRPKRMVATNDGPTRGTKENPYSIDEAYALYYAGLWVGGWVEFYGYIPANLEDWGYYGSGSGTFGSYDPYEEEINPDEGGHGLGGNGDENGENGNQGGENQNGNQGGENVGGGDGNDDGSDNSYNGFATQEDNEWTRNMCLYSCIAYVYNKLYELEIAQQSSDGPILKTTFGMFYYNGIPNHNDMWDGTHNEVDKYAPDPFDENNNPNHDIITFLRCFFNATDWETSRANVNSWLTTSDGSYIIGVFKSGMQKHALILLGYDNTKNQYITHDPTISSSDTSSGTRNASGLLFAVKLSRQ